MCEPFDRSHVLSTFEFDAVRFINFPRGIRSVDSMILNGMGTVVLSLFLRNQVTIFGGLDDIIVSFSNFEMRCSILVASPV